MVSILESLTVKRHGGKELIVIVKSYANYVSNQILPTCEELSSMGNANSSSSKMFNCKVILIVDSDSFSKNNEKFHTDCVTLNFITLGFSSFFIIFVKNYWLFHFSLGFKLYKPAFWTKRHEQ